MTFVLGTRATVSQPNRSLVLVRLFRPTALTALVVLTIGTAIQEAGAISLLDSCVEQSFFVDAVADTGGGEFEKVVEESGCDELTGPEGVQFIFIGGDVGASATIALDGPTVSYNQEAVTVNGFPPSTRMEFGFFSTFLLSIPAGLEPEQTVRVVVDVGPTSTQPLDRFEMDVDLAWETFHLGDPVHSLFQLPLATGQTHELGIEVWTEAHEPGEFTISATVSLVPEPSIVLLIGLGLGSLVVTHLSFRFRRKKVGQRISIPISVLAISLLFPFPTNGMPIVFDFEDGLQVWELYGAATRVQTHVLGGEWAIFGDGLLPGEASISVEMDLTGIASISVKQFFADGEHRPDGFYC